MYDCLEGWREWKFIPIGVMTGIPNPYYMEAPRIFRSDTETPVLLASVKRLLALIGLLLVALSLWMVFR